MDKEAKASQRRNDYQSVLQMPQGRRLLWGILSDAGIFGKCFTGNSNTFYNLGKKEFGLDILSDIIEADPNAYLLAQAEAWEADKQEQQKES